MHLPFLDDGALVELRIVHRYVHLGTACVAAGAIDMEIHNRAALESRALIEIKPILRLGLGYKTNVQRIKLFVFSRLFYNAQVWPRLSDKNLHTIRKVYMKSFRAAFGQSYDGKNEILSDAALMEQHDIDTVENYLAAVRAKFFSKLLVTATESMRTHLSSLVDVEGSFAHALKQNLDSMHGFSKVSFWPLFSQDPHAWTDFLSSYGAEFRDIVDLWLKSRRSTGAGSGIAIEASEIPEPSRAVRSDLHLPHVCSECNLSFSSKQSLGLVVVDSTAIRYPSAG